jgi:hypothetical protein
MAKNAAPAEGANRLSNDTGQIVSPEDNKLWTDGNNAWTTCGYENPGASSRKAWVSDASTGQKLQDGKPVNPPPVPYQWAFTFENLTLGQPVFVTVQFAFPDGNFDKKHAFCKVAS